MRRTSIAVCTVALTATLGGCALGQNPGGAGETGSSDSGAQQGGAYSDLASLVSGASQAMDDSKSYKLKLNATLGSAGGLQSDCDVDAAKSAMSCTGTTGEIIVIDGETYMNNPQLNSMGGDPGKPWAHIAQNSPAAAVGGAQSTALSEAADFRKLLPEGSQFTAAGSDTVDGTQATKYEVVTNINDVVGSAEGILKQSYEMMLKAGVTELKQTVWADEEGRPLKVEQVTPPMNIAGQQVGESTTTLTYSDWGKPVSVAKPDASQIREFEMPGLPQGP
ncbi:hypothetical protein [Saccharopolyspora gregorii]|uniref:LppX_LprAFG lipoprotein n=1 Tax=Saccharopolyspora gregorii TaxID=33914 RepID=A0ABP6RJE0_9PSEU|nr:hypothetical protein [Saccharopolyspora gregorii]